MNICPNCASISCPFTPEESSLLNYKVTRILIPSVSKKYPLLTGNRNEAIGYYYSPNGQLNLSIFNLDSHTLHFKIVHQRPEIQDCEVKIYSAPETRGFEKGHSRDLCHGYFPKYPF